MSAASSIALKQDMPNTSSASDVLEELKGRFGPPNAGNPGGPMGLVQKTADDLPTQWVSRNRVRDVLRYLKLEAERPYRMLYDLTAIDERTRAHRNDQPPSRFTVIYHLLSFERNADVRLKVALTETDLHMPTITDIWPAANWYEREIWDMFGIVFDGHPHLRRILLPPWLAGAFPAQGTSRSRDRNGTVPFVRRERGG